MTGNNSEFLTKVDTFFAGGPDDGTIQSRLNISHCDLKFCLSA